MSFGGALYKGDTWQTGWCAVRLDEGSALTLTTPDGEVSVGLRLSDSSFVDAFATDDWACFLGAADREVVLARRSGPALSVIAEVERIKTGPDTAIGVHAVRFHPLPGTDRCLLAWEIGIALIDPDQGVLWSHVHADPDQRVLSVTADTVELKGLRAAITVDVHTGVADVRERENAVVVDRATLTEWRRGIGR